MVLRSSDRLGNFKISDSPLMLVVFINIPSNSLEGENLLEQRLWKLDVDCNWELGNHVSVVKVCFTLESGFFTSRLAFVYVSQCSLNSWISHVAFRQMLFITGLSFMATTPKKFLSLKFLYHLFSKSLILIIMLNLFHLVLFKTLFLSIWLFFCHGFYFFLFYKLLIWVLLRFWKLYMLISCVSALTVSINRKLLIMWVFLPRKGTQVLSFQLFLSSLFWISLSLFLSLYSVGILVVDRDKLFLSPIVLNQKKTRNFLVSYRLWSLLRYVLSSASKTELE